MRDKLKKCGLIALGCFLFIAAVLLFIAFDKKGDPGSVNFIGVMIFNLMGLSLLVITLQINENGEARIRLLTHTVICYIASFTIIFLNSFFEISDAVVLSVVLGAYVAAYYVFGIVQLPLNRYYGKLGLCAVLSFFK